MLRNREILDIQRMRVPFMGLKMEERKMIVGKLIYLAVSYEFLSNKVNMKKNKDAFYGT